MLEFIHFASALLKTAPSVGAAIAKIKGDTSAEARVRDGIAALRQIAQDAEDALS